jgi:hypothetical protein
MKMAGCKYLKKVMTCSLIYHKEDNCSKVSSCLSIIRLFENFKVEGKMLVNRNAELQTPHTVTKSQVVINRTCA